LAFLRPALAPIVLAPTTLALTLLCGVAYADARDGRPPASALMCHDMPAISRSRTSG